MTPKQRVKAIFEERYWLLLFLLVLLISTRPWIQPVIILVSVMTITEVAYQLFLRDDTENETSNE